MDSDFSDEMNRIGLHVYTAGIAVQQFFILCFCGLLFAFHRRMQEHGGILRGNGSQTLVVAMSATLIFITVGRLSYGTSSFWRLMHIRSESSIV